jgi:TP901 family phage tail tape measure protein
MATTGGIRAGRAFVVIEAVDRTSIVLDKIAMKLRKFSDKLREISMTSLKVGAIGALPGIFGAMQFSAFEQQLADMQASSNMSNDQLGKLRDTALGLSKALGLDPVQLAEGFKELAKAGMSVDNILAGAGARAAMFAKVAGVSAEQGAIVMNDMMNVFKVSAAEAIDTLSGAADSSSVSLAQMVDAMAMASSIGKQAGQNLLDVSTALAMVGQNGVKGSDAGTALKMMMLQLASPTNTGKKAMDDLGISVRDVNTKEMLPMRDIIAELSQELGVLDKETRANKMRDIFGTDGVRVANILLDAGVKGWDDYQGKIQGSASVADKFRIIMDTLNGAWERAMAAVKRLGIELGSNIAPVLKITLRLFEFGADALGAWVKAHPKTVGAIMGISTAMVVLGASGVAVSFAIKSAAIAINGFSAVLRAAQVALYVARAAVLAVWAATRFLSVTVVLNTFALGIWKAVVLATTSTMLLLKAAVWAINIAFIALKATIIAMGAVLTFVSAWVGMLQFLIGVFGMLAGIVAFVQVAFMTAFTIIAGIIANAAAACIPFVFALMGFAIAITGLIIMWQIFGSALMAVLAQAAQLVVGVANLFLDAFSHAVDGVMAAVRTLFGVFASLREEFAKTWGGIMSAINGGRVGAAMAIAAQYMKMAFIGLGLVMHQVVATGKLLWINLATAITIAMNRVKTAIVVGMQTAMLEVMYSLSKSWGGQKLLELMFGDNWQLMYGALLTARNTTITSQPARDAEENKKSDYERAKVVAELLLANAKTEREWRKARAELDKLIEDEAWNTVLDEFFGGQPTDTTTPGASGADPGGTDPGVVPGKNAVEALDGLQRGSIEAQKKAWENSVGADGTLKLIGIGQSQLIELRKIKRGLGSTGGV